MAKSLKKGEITIAEVLRVSLAYYKSAGGDNKGRRAKLDVKSAKLIVRKNFSYDPKTRTWGQTPTQEVRLVFMVRSKPISYNIGKDAPKVRYYPVTFIIRDISKGINSPFTWRTGSLKKPRFAKPNSSKEQRKAIETYNLKNNIQMQFFFDTMFVSHQYKLLFGPNWAGWAPKIRNPNFEIFFDKHSHYIVTNILIGLLADPGKLKLNKVFK